jgi:hypothetical protein
MVEKKVNCPVCSNSGNSYKVSDIYLQSLMRLKDGDKAEAPIIDRLQQEIPVERREKLKGSRYYRQLMESFAPPQGESQTTRAINPDWVIAGLGLITIFFLYQIFTSQYQVFWYILILTAILFTAYFLFRKRFQTKYQAVKDQETFSKQSIEKAIGRWMKLYYCARDNVVFLEGKGETIPIEQMNSYLRSQ